jgi:hypothetical protein
MDKKYVWRELTDDGILKKPEAFGPYYERDETLRFGGWDTEEDAVAAYKKVYDCYKYQVNSEFVLVCIWSER